MGEAENSRRRRVESPSLQISSYPRDLLTRFNSTDVFHPKKKPRAQTREDEESDEIELNLGLSLGGRFGVDKLVRSSSIAGSLPDALCSAANEYEYPLLARTASLPTETEEAWRRKRKEMQSMRRMVAKRRRCERQRSSNGDLSSLEEDKKDFGSSNHNHVRQGSQESHSSGVSELESNHKPPPPQAFPTSNRYSQEQPNKPARASKTSEKMAKPSSQEDMPCVFTIGDGPGGRRVEGILYKYGKGEEVRIMCVCHGSFLSPAEFVKHAGGRISVDHPLRHIVVNPAGPSF